MKEEILYLPNESQAEVFVRRWSSETARERGVLQIVHGMAEHSERYREFGEFLTEQGYVVYVNDHRGHGHTAEKFGQAGIFAKRDGWKKVLDDVYALTKLIKQNHSKQKIYILGHSMGSFITRNVLAMYPDAYDGAIISGTNFERGWLLHVGRFLARVQGVFFPKETPSVLLTKITFKDYNTPFKPTKTAFDWLSNDYERNKSYRDDPFCGRVMSNRFYVDIFTLIKRANSEDFMKRIRKDLPMFILSGDMDPVGRFGKDIEALAKAYEDLGMKKLKMKLYKDGRHEMLNDMRRKEVFADILAWLNKN